MTMHYSVLNEPFSRIILPRSFFMIKKYLHSIGKGSESFFSINKGRGTYLTEKKIDY